MHKHHRWKSLSTTLLDAVVTHLQLVVVPIYDREVYSLDVKCPSCEFAHDCEVARACLSRALPSFPIRY